jgi:hypothetical protein
VDIKEILKEEYSKKDGLKQAMNLMEMIEEVMSVVSLLNEEEAPNVVPTDDTEAIEMILKMIPNIEVSEIGWSDVRTPEAGEEIKGPQRKLLEDYLSNIGGDDFKARIENVSKFYDDGTGMVQERAGNDRTQRIVQAISYLVFYKTLTKVITNFNASSAGFSFESFLAALVNGYQIPANTGTIADYIDRASGEQIPVSLKLYKEGNLEVGGSYTDLVNDLTMTGEQTKNWASSFPNAMRYVVCTKLLTGDDLEQEGQIKFYQFDFTLDNVVDILANSKDSSKKCIMIPRRVMNALKGGQLSNVDLDLPDAGTLPSPQELEKVFIDALRKIIEDNGIPIDEVGFKDLTKKLEWSENDDLFQPADAKRFGGVEQGVVRGISATDPNARKEIVNALFPQMPWRGGRQALITAIGAANKVVTDQHTASKKADERNREIVRMVQGDEFLSPEESMREYNMLKNPERKKVALKNSWGYLTTGHFSMNQTQATNTGAPTNTIEIGVIRVGRSEVANVVNSIRDILNEEVTEIFKSLKILSDSLNSFFAGGLKDDSLAGQSISNANNISSKEILQTDK